MIENILMGMAMGAIASSGMLGMYWISAHFERRNRLARAADKYHTKVMNLVFKQENWRILLHDFESVDFDILLEAACRGEDFRALYPHRIQALVAENTMIETSEPIKLN